jgi:hypothetical protein
MALPSIEQFAPVAAQVWRYTDTDPPRTAEIQKIIADTFGAGSPDRVWADACLARPATSERLRYARVAELLKSLHSLGVYRSWHIDLERRIAFLCTTARFRGAIPTWCVDNGLRLGVMVLGEKPDATQFREMSRIAEFLAAFAAVYTRGYISLDEFATRCLDVAAHVMNASVASDFKDVFARIFADEITTQQRRGPGWQIARPRLDAAGKLVPLQPLEVICAQNRYREFGSPPGADTVGERIAALMGVARENRYGIIAFLSGLCLPDVDDPKKALVEALRVVDAICEGGQSRPTDGQRRNATAMIAQAFVERRIG